jgi:AcrR family transcriptional regulator
MCLIAQGTLACGEEADAIRQEVAARRQKGEALLRERLERAILEGELSPDTDVAALAGYFATVLRGLGVSASSGASREDLMSIARIALRVWPGESVIPSDDSLETGQPVG